MIQYDFKHISQQVKCFGVSNRHKTGMSSMVLGECEVLYKGTIHISTLTSVTAGEELKNECLKGNKSSV